MNIQQPSSAILTGCTEAHLVALEDGALIHNQMQNAWHNLCQAAATDGIEIRIVSAFRGFRRQAAIWQAKCDGLRPTYDLQQQQVAVTRLNGLAKLQAILLYSALPGASRHHWGTELDIYDAGAVASDYQPRLLPSEYEAQGPFTKLNQWLSTEAVKFGFFRPYRQYRGGVAAEPWHLSYAPIAKPYLQEFNIATLTSCLQQHPIAEQHCVLANLPQLYQTYVTNICEES
ncbi:MAG: D-alanyl-D-alanine carboxypeptidase [Rheinheimera sp.]|uniref:M15 family metallopeptidase n=1 Tax=Arsukibacterium sp. UBA3155 TaxID=1946058 RepID=UPI000C92A670|nr:M15 family metallopeptidase [Arsukibacterium sp. UBA3155]MAD76833.1 D-alanyl-D-alanine carboxypeptidase [Rheinheimera sp.]|tara:strand:+ start:18931 stop:19620 length:690 start_codon:yes stop_codon:yes gene_type:complete